FDFVDEIVDGPLARRCGRCRSCREPSRHPRLGDPADAPSLGSGGRSRGARSRAAESKREEAAPRPFEQLRLRRNERLPRALAIRGLMGDSKYEKKSEN